LFGNWGKKRFLLKDGNWGQRAVCATCFEGRELLSKSERGGWWPTHTENRACRGTGKVQKISVGQEGLRGTKLSGNKNQFYNHGDNKQKIAW